MPCGRCTGIDSGTASKEGTGAIGPFNNEPVPPFHPSNSIAAARGEKRQLCGPSRGRVIDARSIIKEELGFGIVLLESLPGEFAVFDSVAVDASGRAGVIFTDVTRLEAAAFLTISLKLRVQDLARHALEPRGIDTASLNRTRHEAVPLRTDGEAHAVRSRNGHEV